MRSSTLQHEVAEARQVVIRVAESRVDRGEALEPVAHDQLVGLIVTEVESERPLEDVGELLILVRMLGNDAPFF